MDNTYVTLKRTICFLLSIFVGLTFLHGNYVVAADDTITIYHTNDMHGNVGSASKKGKLTRIGLDYVKKIKDSTPNSLLVDCGDSTQGAALAAYSQGKAVVELMNETGYDASTLGNHAFDYGQEALIHNMEFAKFPFICANLYYEKTGNPVSKDINESNGSNFIKEISGHKIGFFGLTTPETKTKMNPSNLEGVNVNDIIESAKKQVEFLRAQDVDIIVALTHLGVNASVEDTSIKLAEEVPEINIILDGHSHTEVSQIYDHNLKTLTDGSSLPVSLDSNKTIIQQTGKEMSNLGKVEINFSTKQITFSLMKSATIGIEYSPDESITKKFDEIYDSQSEIRDKVIGKTNGTLYSHGAPSGAEVKDNDKNGQRISRYTECNMGDLVADAFVFGAKEILKNNSEYSNTPIVALQNGAAVRSRIEPGDITNGNLNDVNIYGGSLSIKELTPKILYDVLETSVMGIPDPKEDGNTSGINCDGAGARFGQISGIRFEYDVTKAPRVVNGNNVENQGNRVQAIYLLQEDGSYSETPLSREDNSTKILIVLNDYEATGQDDYIMFPELKSVAEGSSLNEVLANYISSITEAGDGSFYYPASQERIKLLNEDTLFEPFSSTITVKTENDEIISNQMVKISVDDQTAEYLETDNNGQITLNNLYPTAHNISVEYEGMRTDGYVDGRTGNAGTILGLDDFKNVVLKLFKSSYDEDRVTRQETEQTDPTLDNENESSDSKVITTVPQTSKSERDAEDKSKQNDIPVSKNTSDSSNFELLLYFSIAAISLVFMKLKKVR